MVSTRLKGRDLISITDFNKEELETVVDTALEIKYNQVVDRDRKYLEDRTMGMFFAKPSTRTRISFETALSQLGGHAQYLTEESLQLAHGETWEDTAKVMDRYLDALGIRMYNIEGMSPEDTRNVLLNFAKYTDIPVINMLDDQEHPCQILADFLTMKEKLGNLKDKKIVMSWAYSDRVKSPGVPNSMTLAAAILGTDLTLAYPEKYGLEDSYMEKAEKLAEKSGANITHVNDLSEAAKDANILYAKSWGSQVMDRKEDERYRQDLKDDWIVDDSVMGETANDGMYMHCLPADREDEVTDEVLDGEGSIVFDQAENRLHAQKALLALTTR